MGHPDVGQDAVGGANHLGQALHLVGTGDARLEDGYVRALIQLPNRERHADLGVVAVGAAGDVPILGQHMGQPLLDDGLAVAAGDADGGHLELLAVGRGDGLQRGKGIVNAKHIAIPHPTNALAQCVGQRGHHKVANPLGQQLGNVAVPVVTVGLEGEEERLLRFPDFPAVKTEFRHEGLRVTHEAFNRIQNLANIVYNHINIYVI